MPHESELKSCRYCGRIFKYNGIMGGGNVFTQRGVSQALGFCTLVCRSHYYEQFPPNCFERIRTVFLFVIIWIVRIALLTLIGSCIVAYCKSNKESPTPQNRNGDLSNQE